jgi:hypothetical protein
MEIDRLPGPPDIVHQHKNIAHSTQKALFWSHLLNEILHYKKPKMKYNTQFIIKRFINEKSLSNTTNMESSIMLPTTNFTPYHALLQYHLQ